MIKRYRKKPVVIEAIQYTGDSDNIAELREFVTCGFKKNKDSTLTVPTLEGKHIASIRDYIIKGVEGEFYPCKPRIFKKTYKVCNDQKIQKEPYKCDILNMAYNKTN